MHDYELKLLNALKGKKESSLQDLENETSISRDSILWAIENLVKQNAVSVKRKELKNVMLSDEGKSYSNEFPEERLVKKMKESKGKESVANIKDQVALTWAKKNGWIMIDKGIASLTESGNAATQGIGYEQRTVLGKLAAARPDAAPELISKNKQTVDTLSKRGLIEIKEKSAIESVSITPAGEKLLSSAPKEQGIGQLTREAIATKAWEKQGFKTYDVNAPFEPVYPGRLHPVREFVNQIRQKWLEMGFVEVSGPIIESAFWNFDALFVPQDHPSREMQDTFFLKQPDELSVQDLEALSAVKKMHKTGWKETWEEEIAKGALLRTQVTALSARYMRYLSFAVSTNYPLKLFSVGKVFRNESIDYKHLAEFYQYEGIIVGDNLTLANLIYSLKEFYAKLGFENVKIRPSYFPFTEPSLEGYYHDDDLDADIELTGAGIIRKEITKALGINKTVLAWGGGIERLLFNKLNLESITTPYKNNVGWLRSRKSVKE